MSNINNFGRTVRLGQMLLILFVTLGLSSCVAYRGLLYGASSTTDHKIFHQTAIKKGDNIFTFVRPEVMVFDTLKLRYRDSLRVTLDDYLKIDGATAAFVLIQNDTILFEKYYRGYDQSTTATVFSVSKSLTSLLTGIAIREGYISSVDDPVTKYLPELNDKDPMFKKLTIRHLLDMRAGLKFSEDYSMNPFSGIGRLYYGVDYMQQVKGLKFTSEPGTKHYYNSMATTILGLVLERAIGRNLGEYMEEKVWKPLDMQYDASVSLDDKKHRAAKAFGGFSLTAIDLAKIGRLYLNKGNYNGKQIVDTAWIEKSATPNYENEGYQNCWYSVWSNYITDKDGSSKFSDSMSVIKRIEELNLDPALYVVEHQRATKWKRVKYPAYWYGYRYTKQYYALGLFGQVLYVDPERNLIGVRLGPIKDDEYDEVIRNITSKLPIVEKCL